MRFPILLTLAFALLPMQAALAGEKLAQDKQCMGCHAMKEDAAAPSFKKIATYWKGRKDAETQLVSTIREGSAGTGGPHWNKAKMPDQAERPRVSDEEARKLARWILSL